MKKFSQTKKMITYNLWTLVGFESAFKILSFFIFTPMFFKIFNLIMKVTGYNYLTFENLFFFLRNPFTIFLLIMLILLLLIYTMFDITTIIIILDASYHEQKIKILDAIFLSLKKCLRLFNPKNIMLSFLVLFLIPLLNIGVASNFITTIKIPEYILEFIIKNKLYLIGFILAFIGLMMLFFRWIYALHYFVLEEMNFKEAREKSVFLSKEKRGKDMITLLIMQLIITIVYFFFILVGISVILFFNKIFGSIILLKSIITTIIWVFIAFSFLIFTVLTTPTSYAVLSALYYLHKRESKESIKLLPLEFEKKEEKKKSVIKRIIYFLIFLAMIGATIFTYGVYNGKYNLNIEHTRTGEVTAHRGASKESPENTMSAFIKAKELGADYIELDVGQTKDNYLIIMHDTNLKRTTGLDKKVWELTYEEIRELDAGYFFDSTYEGEKIPTLEEVLIFAKDNNIKLNIELKPTGHENNFERSVVDLILKYNLTEDSVVTSSHYEVLENIKNYNSNIKTGYVKSLLYGDVSSFTAADIFSIEATSITKSLVNQIHAEGKQIYAWTLNTKENIEKAIDLRVDNIITDDVTLAKETIYKSKTSNLINDFVKWIEETFR